MQDDFLMAGGNNLGPLLVGDLRNQLIGLALTKHLKVCVRFIQEQGGVWVCIEMCQKQQGLLKTATGNGNVQLIVGPLLIDQRDLATALIVFRG